MDLFADEWPMVAAAAERWAAWAARRTGRPGDLGDHRQEILLAIWERRGKYDPARGAPGPFVMACARAKARMIVRSHWRQAAAATTRALPLAGRAAAVTPEQARAAWERLRAQSAWARLLAARAGRGERGEDDA